jgi:hypothetical protein
VLSDITIINLTHEEVKNHLHLYRNAKKPNLSEQPLGQVPSQLFSLSLERCGLCLNERMGDVWRSFSSTSPNEPTAVTGLTMAGGSCKRETAATKIPSACA